MTQEEPLPRPPWLAAWLVELFTPAEQADSILGDLHEEFSEVTSKSGVAAARRWYWRQSVKTICHLSGAAFRNAPWSIAGIVLLGFLLNWLSARLQLPENVIMAILRAQRPYSNLHYGFYVWLINYGISISCVVTSLLIGCIVAILAKGREVVTALTLIVVHAVPFIWLLVLLYEHNPDRGQAFAASMHFFMFRRALDVVSTLVGGVLVRKLRSVSLPPITVT
ncbi:MAG TPA: permease prefix domain 2-containing transporter [Candidatus Acidoferrum sp.]|nr:permease prefix domain 2-containing transporter [Candidatus Acidoferrum sp.]